MTVATRLTYEGDFLVNGHLDEVTQSSISVANGVVYAAQFDEVTINPKTSGIVKRETFDGRLLISGNFDETYDGAA